MSQDFVDKLKHIEGAFAHPVHGEESNWFIDLKTKTPAADQIKLTKHIKNSLPASWEMSPTSEAHKGH
jgi:hypothetical protein